MTGPEKLFSVRGKVIVITGGAGFLGMEYATFLSRAGARVVLLDIVSPDILRAKAAEIYRRSGRRPLALPVDITDASAVKRVVRHVLGRHHGIDALINNAALNPVPDSPESAQQFSPYERYPVDLWRKEIEVGLTGAFITTQAVIPVMKRQRSGIILNIGSIYGEKAPDNRIYQKGKFKSIAYATVKGSMRNFTRALAAYLAPFGIRVNQMSLAGVYAGQNPQFVKKHARTYMFGHMANRSDFNGGLLYLLSDASAYMTGANVVIDGGFTAW